jgi:hypothetical protein
VGVEPTFLVFEPGKTVDALDREVAGIGIAVARNTKQKTLKKRRFIRIRIFQ